MPAPVWHFSSEIRRICSELATIFTSIESEGQRAGDAVDSVRAMFANRPTERHQFDVNKLIRETTALMSAEFAQAKVSLTLELDGSAPPVVADRRQIQHVLLNLLSNSIEAMSPMDDGRPRHVIVRSACPSATTLQITMEDSGMGFEEGQLERMFDTFFTTKAQGTGMGLSLCRAIVQSHAGRLWADSSESAWRRSPCAAAYCEHPECKCLIFKSWNSILRLALKQSR